MSSSWDKYVSYTLARERSILFSKEELAIVDEVRAELARKGNVDAFDGLAVEDRLTLIRGYTDR